MFSTVPRRTAAVRRAFSLVELTVVLLVMGIMAAVALPAWSGRLAQSRVDAAAQRLVTDLNRTQSLAFASSSTQSLTVNASQSSYQIAGAKDLDRASGTYLVKLTDPPYLSTVVSANFAGQSQVSFDGYGMPTPTGGTIVLQSGSLQRTITVDADTGKATSQ